MTSKAEEIKEIRIWLDAFSRGSYAGSILASFLHLVRLVWRQASSVG